MASRHESHLGIARNSDGPPNVSGHAGHSAMSTGLRRPPKHISPEMPGKYAGGRGAENGGRARPIPRPARRSARRRRDRAVRDLRARAVLCDPVRLLRLQHLHRGRAGHLGVAAVVAGGGAVRIGSRRGSARVHAGGIPPVRDGVRRRRHPVTARRRRASRRSSRRSARSFGLAPDAEVTTESNPESTSPEFFAAIAAAGFTRVSLGMQSAAPHVLAVLDRTHTPGRAVDGRAGGAGRGLRARQPRPDLRHPGRDATPTSTPRSRRCSPPASTTSRRTR